MRQFIHLFKTNEIKFFIPVLFFVFGFSFTSNAQVNGRNVNYVEYNGNELGTFEKIADNKWAEYKDGKGKPHDTFEEIQRDDWSVYLRKFDGATIQLDLHTKKITYNEGFLYTITKAKLSQVNGRNCNYVEYNGSELGTFEKTLSLIHI